MEFNETPVITFARLSIANLYYGAFIKLYNGPFSLFLSGYSGLYHYGYHGQLLSDISGQLSHTPNIVIGVADHDMRVLGTGKQDNEVKGVGDSGVGNMSTDSIDFDNSEGTHGDRNTDKANKLDVGLGFGIRNHNGKVIRAGASGVRDTSARNRTTSFMDLDNN